VKDDHEVNMPQRYDSIATEATVFTPARSRPGGS
jgi:hypothetical protein